MFSTPSGNEKMKQKQFKLCWSSVKTKQKQNLMNYSSKSGASFNESTNNIHPCPFTLVFLHKKRRFQDVSPYVFFNQIELTNQKRSSRLTCSGRHLKWPYFGGKPPLFTVKNPSKWVVFHHFWRFFEKSIKTGGFHQFWRFSRKTMKTGGFRKTGKVVENHQNMAKKR